MILGIEIALAIVGIMALVRGKMTLSKTKIVVGVQARLLGLLALTPFPLALAAVVAYVASQGGAVNQDDQWTVIGIEAGIVIGIAVLVFGLGAVMAISPEEAERRARRSRRPYDDYADEGDGRDGDRDDDRRQWDR